MSCVCLQEEARRVALKQRAERTAHSESLGWEEEDEEGLILKCNIKTFFQTSHLSYFCSLSRWVSWGSVYVSIRFHPSCWGGTRPFCDDRHSRKLLTPSSGGFPRQRHVWHHTVCEQRQCQFPHPDREPDGPRLRDPDATCWGTALAQTLRGQREGRGPRGETITTRRDRQRGRTSRPPSVWAQLGQRQIHTLQ